VATVAGKVPGAVIGGDKKGKGSLAVTVRNDSGADFNGPVTVAVLASTDAVADAGDTTLASSAKPLKLKAGQSKAVKLSVLLMNLPQGQYTLLGSATAGGLTASAAGPAVSVAPPFVHLVNGGPAAPPKPITPGKKASLSIPLRNDGNVATSKTPATYTLLLSPDGTESNVAFQTTATGKLALKPGTAKPQKLAVTFPAGAFASGTYTLIVKVNAELNDANGQTVALIPVTVG
jgi:hypothetical protein